MASETIGQRLREAIERSNYSVRSFAEAANLPYRSVQNYASDTQKPGSEALVQIRNTLHISVDWLVCGNDKPDFDVREFIPREATLADLMEIGSWIEKFEYPEDLALTIASLIKTGKDLRASIRRFTEPAMKASKMAVRLRDHQANGAIQDVDLDSLKMRQMFALYQREFGEPDF